MKTRVLTEADRPALQAVCGQEPEYNLFLLANLQQLSGNQELVQYWGQFDQSGRIIAVLMRYHVLWYLYDTPGTELRTFASVIESQASPRIVVNDNVRSAPSLIPLLKNYRVELDFAARLRRLYRGRLSGLTVTYPARQATLEDVERLTQFYAHAPEDVRRGPDSIRRSIGGGRRTFLVEANGEIVASALTTAELPNIAMIGGLHTPSHLCDREYLTWATAELAHSLLSEDKRVCVVTRDPLIDAICDRLGFDDAGPWRIVHLRRKT